MSAKLPDDKLGVTRLQPHIHDVRAMSVCAPQNETARAVERYAQGGGWG